MTVPDPHMQAVADQMAATARDHLPHYVAFARKQLADFGGREMAYTALAAILAEAGGSPMLARLAAAALIELADRD